jgi:uncharacterized protein (DUF58 family)
MDSGKTSLLDPDFLRKLERMRLLARRAFPGTMRGERRSTRKGASVEFSDFRKYEAGDDFRHVDWNIFARLERLMLRQFVEEEDVRIDILIDQSRSMHFGKPLTKFDQARRATAALAFLAISSLDRAGVQTFDSAPRARLRAMRGRGHLVSILSFLENLSKDRKNESIAEQSEGEDIISQGGHTDLASVLRGYQKTAVRAGVLFVISDFLDAGDFRRQMKLISHRGFDVNLIQVLAPEEISPELGGDLLLVDSETGETREITINERALASYKKTLAGFTESLESFCRASGIGYLMVASDTPLEDLLLRKLVESRMAE